ncbi:S-layer homology domain-containing protein [Paenibacillus sp. FSL H8-0537]|uniref:S-layer homology domain-containing protein n=1 Tax=Paenibacillus sp. FSL H8-0537 TaxID=2921399 RepID=UPI0031017DDF
MRETSNSFSKENSQQPKQFRGGEKKVMKKSLLASVLSLSLAMAVTVPAFAATPTDVAGVKEQSAIEELVALGIINGYTDGTFKPGNSITRAELAKIIVIATGSEKAATALQNVKSSFKDVKTNEWYTGYINVATGKGLLLGDKGTKNFRPNANIKFEEVAAIVVRALGYQDSNLTGSWPYNVTLKAEEVGVFKKVDLALGTAATRGVVAQQVSNALGTDLVEWNADSKLYGKNGKKLISRLGTTTEEVVTSAVLDDNGRLSLNGLSKTLAPNFIITGGVKLVDLLAHNVTVLADTDGRIRAITSNQNENNVVTGKLNADFNNALQVEVKNGTAVTKYNTVGNSVYYFNSDSVAGNDSNLKKDADVSVYLFDNNSTNVSAGVVGKVRAVVVSKANGADKLLDSYIAATSTAKARILTQDNLSVSLNDSTSIVLNGEAKAATDLAKNDVLDIVYNKDRVAVKVVATRNVVEGKVTLVSTSVDGTFVYTIDGKTYTSVKGANLTGSKEVTKDGSFKLFLNKDGKVAGAELLSGGSSDAKYGVILNAENKVSPSGAFGDNKDVFKYYSIKENKTAEVSLNELTWVGGTDANKAVQTTIRLGDAVDAAPFTGATTAFNNTAAAFVTWTLKNSDASINGIKEITPLSEAWEVKEKKDTTLKVSNGTTTITYEINANTVVLDANTYNKATAGDRKVETSTLANLAVGNKVTIVPDGTSTFAKYVLITKKSATDAKETKYGLFVGAAKTGDDYSITINVKGTEETLALTGTEGAAIYNSIVTSKSAGNSTYEKDSRTLVEVKDSVIVGAAGNLAEASTSYDTVNVYAATNALQEVNNSDSTVKVNDKVYYVNSSTAIYVYDEANNTLVTDGIFADVSAHLGEATNKYGIAIVGDASYGNFTLAKAIVVVKKK